MENGTDTDDVYSYLKLSVKRAGSLGEEMSEKVTGSFRWWEKIGTFGELVRDENVTANYWDIDDVEWAEIPEDDEVPPMHEYDENDIKKRQRFGHGITVLKTLDDKGHHFIELIYNVGPQETGGQTMMRALGKKQKDNEGRFGLTVEEANRLMKDEVAEELDGGWAPTSESDEEDESILPSTTERTSADKTDILAGTKRKAEDKADDSGRRPVYRKD